MKKITLLVIIAIASLSFASAQDTAVPDANFEQALIDLGLDIDLTINGQVPTAGINMVTTLDISNKGIIDLAGIEGFSALENLNISNNNIDFLVTEFNPQLATLDASNNSLTIVFFEFSNILTTIDLSDNANLASVDLSNLGNINSLTINNMGGLHTLKINNANNAGINNFSATGNPNLTCIQVDDVAFANANWTAIDAHTSFSTFCIVDPFITTWQTTLVNETITIPTNGNGYFYSIDWGDGNTEENVGIGNKTHTYETPGVYTVQIGGNFPRIFFNDTGDKDKILSVEQWGNLQWTNMTDAFNGCSNLQVNATDAPDLTGVVNLSRMFKNCTTLNANFNHWDVSTIRFMPGMFDGATNFNGPIDAWTTTSLELTVSMFNNADAFNQPLNSWNVSNVTNMHSMFKDADVFNQPLDNWNVSNVVIMHNMFNNADMFNQSLNNWNVSNVNNMADMFSNTNTFNQPLNNWIVSNVASMHYMFRDTNAFNQPLNNWDVSNVTNMLHMFRNADAFNQSLSNWDVSNVTNMEQMFYATSISTSNYDATLIGWSQLPSLFPNVNFNGGASQYCYSQFERQSIIDTYGWSISDGGIDATCPDNIDAFLTSWQTTTVNENITIPTIGAGYNYAVDWGDGTVESGFTSDATHTYISAGTYQVEITGDFPQIYFNNFGDKDKIQSVDQWGNISWRSMANAFYGCSNLVVNTSDIPNLTGATTTGGMFWEATSLTGGVSNWNMNTITSMTDMFNGATSFNENISNWNVNNVTHMDGMFRGATAFNQDLIWNTTSLGFTRSMFQDATSFNGNISSWQLGTLEEMDDMFNGASVFNQDISGWTVSNVREMDNAFDGAIAFNQPIGSWSTGMVTEMQSMFFGATAFNQDLSNWNVSSVQFMQNMFDGATAFDQSLATWDVGLVGNMDGMFNGVTLSTPNYDATLIAWANLPLLQDSVPFDGGNSQYCEAEQVRFDVLQGIYNWQITDGDLDLTPPTAVCQNITISLDIFGKATITPEQIDNGSTANCGDLILALDKTEFTCDDIGDTTVILTVSDFIGFSVSCSAIVTVLDDIVAPTVEAYNQEITLDATGNITITAEDILRTNGFFAVAKNGIGTPPVNVAFFDYNTTTDAVALNKEYEDVFPANSNIYAIDGNPANGKAYAIASIDPLPNIRFLYQINLNEGDFGANLITQIVSSTGDTKPTGMSFGVDGSLYVVFQDGVIESYDFDADTINPFTTVGTTASAQGLTYDYDNNRLLYVKNSNPVELFEISLPDGVVTPLFNFSIDLGNGACGAQAIEYAGNNKLVVSATETNGVLCDGIYKVDLTTQTTEVLLTPTGTINEIKDILLPYYGDDCGPYTASIDVTTFDCEDQGNDNAVNITFTDANGNSSATEINIDVLNNPNNPCGAKVSPKVILQGPALNPNVGEESLMRDDLRVNGLLSTTSPYEDQLTTSPTSFNSTGNDAIVDWVYVELRDAIDPTIVVDGKSALLRRNGNIVSTHGFSIVFNVIGGNYHVVIKHRNHLSVMTNSPLPLSNTSIGVDFTDAINPIAFGVEPQTDFGIFNGAMAMWAGNVNGNVSIAYQGSDNDTNAIKDNVLADSGNTSNSNLHTYTAYDNADVNLDGMVSYQGSDNDSNTIKDIILSHPSNTTSSNLYTTQEQLPEN